MPTRRSADAGSASPKAAGADGKGERHDHEGAFAPTVAVASAQLGPRSEARAVPSPRDATPNVVSGANVRVSTPSLGIAADDDDAFSDATLVAPPPGQDANVIIARRYRLLRVLGEGGMGTVHEAEHIELKKRVAIKVLKSGLASYPEATKRFVREAQAASRIDSENIVQVFDVGEDVTHGLYMVMELLRGDGLSAVIARQGRFAPQDAAAIAVQACNALERAHAAGIVHRDLKTGNLFLQRVDEHTTRVKVLDFGIAKLLDGARQLSSEALTATGVMLGTPQYMAPEQVEGHELDHRTDIYGLGALLFECLTGTPPHGFDAPYQRVLMDVLTKPPPRVASKVPSIPPALDELVATMMARKPADRPPSAAAVRARLLAIFPALADLRPRYGLGSSGDALALSRADSARSRRAPPTSGEFPSPPDGAPRPSSKAPKPSTRRATFLTILAVAACGALGGYLGRELRRQPALEAAATTSAERGTALLQKARIAIASGTPALAVELARGAVQEQPENAEGWLTLGAAYEALDNHVAALGAYRDCIARAKGDRVGECVTLAGR